MKELSKVTKYNRLKTCKKQTRSANASKANEGCLSRGGGQKITVTTFTQKMPQWPGRRNTFTIIVDPGIRPAVVFVG